VLTSAASRRVTAFGLRADFAGGADAGGAAIAAAAVADQFQGRRQQRVVQFKEALAEADPAAARS
jgi:hypothetical protein